MSQPASLIDPRAHLDPNAQLGPGCVLRSGAYVGAGALLEAGVHLDANVALVDCEPGQHTVLKPGVRVGANATVLPGVVIAAKAVVRPGSVVSRSVPPNAIVEGNPASIVGYVDTAHESVPALRAPAGQAPASVEQTSVHGVSVHHFPVIPDMRGNLTVGEFERQIPFTPKRYFMVFGVPSREVRGEHAHHRCHQFLICLHGSCSVVADDGERKVEVELNAPHRGLYLPPMTWGIQYKHSPDALLLVFASDYYDASDYIRDYGDFLQLVQQRA